MPTSFNALLLAWAITLIVIVGGALALEMTYDPVPDRPGTAQAPGGQMPAASQTPESQTPDRDPAGRDHQEPAPTDIPADTGAGGPETTPDTPPATGDGLLAPGQAEPNATAPTAAGTASIVRRLPVQADMALLEQDSLGLLPKKSADGRTPYDVYSAPMPTNDKPRIAIILSDMGMRVQPTRLAMAELPAPVSFAFSPYAANLIEWGERSRDAGHEVLLMVPMEPVNYPENDPGPMTLLTSQSPRDNINLLKASLGRLTGYVGVVNHMGSRFTAAGDSIQPVLKELQDRGLMFIDGRASQYSRAFTMASAMGMPAARNDRYVDDSLATADILNELAELEKRARIYGAAVGMGRPYPVTIDAIKAWTDGLEARGFALAPISSIAGRQTGAN